MNIANHKMLNLYKKFKLNVVYPLALDLSEYSNSLHSYLEEGRHDLFQNGIVYIHANEAPSFDSCILEVTYNAQEISEDGIIDFLKEKNISTKL